MKKYILSLLVAVGLIGSASAQLVAQWKLDGNANDSIGSANGTTAGVTYTDSVINGYHRTVANFDGTGGIIFNNNISNLQVGSSLTVSAWVNVSYWGSSGGNNDFAVFTTGNPTSFPSNPHQAAIFAGFSQNYSDFSLDSVDAYPYRVFASSRSSIVNTTDPVTDWSQRTLGITTYQWNLLTWVYDGSNVCSYLNGNVLFQNESYSNGSNLSPYSPISMASIGVDNGVSPQGPIFNGLMSDVQLYNIALSSSQVYQLYTLQSAPEPSTYALFGIGSIGLLMVMLWKKGSLMNRCF